MPRAATKTKSRPPAGKPPRPQATGRTYLVTLRQGDRTFHRVEPALDEKGNLHIIELSSTGVPSTVIVYASGVWDAYECLADAAPAERDLPPGLETPRPT
jgi:hypothetical protein